MKITSLFSRISSGSSKPKTENHNDKSLNMKSLPSPVSSPDIIPPSPIMKKKSIKAKRSLNCVLIDDIDLKNKSTNNIILPKVIHSKNTLDLASKTIENSKVDDHDVDSQSCYGTESVASTVCDDTDFCSDLLLDDWNDSCSSVFKYIIDIKFM